MGNSKLARKNPRAPIAKLDEYSQIPSSEHEFLILVWLECKINVITPRLLRIVFILVIL